MNIGILTARLPSTSTGGAEVQASKLAALLAAKHRVTIFTRSEAIPHELSANPNCDTVRRSRWNIPGVRFGTDLIESLIEIGRRRKDVDVLIGYQAVIDGLLGVLVKLLYGIPVIVSVRAEKEYQLERDWRSRLFSPFVFRHADIVAVQTETIKKELLAGLTRAGHTSLSAEVAKKLRVLPNGISPRDGGPFDGDTVLYLGRLVEAKGVRYLIEAMEECPDQQLVIAGDGPEMERLERLADGMDNVSFAGRVAREELDNYFRKARVLVLPSLRDEGMPNAIMEAMVRGIPVIASRNAGIPDLVRNGETGFLVEPADTGAIARSIAAIFADPDVRTKLGKNCVHEMKRYDWPAVVESVERELLELVELS